MRLVFFSITLFLKKKNIFWDLSLLVSVNIGEDIYPRVDSTQMEMTLVFDDDTQQALYLERWLDD